MNTKYIFPLLLIILDVGAAKSYRKTKTKEKATKKLQFLSDLKGVPITEHIRIILFNFKVLKLKSQEESKDGKELIR